MVFDAFASRPAQEASSQDAARGSPIEPELVRRLRLGDPGALDGIMEACWEPLVAYAARMTGSPDGAEDLAQEAFICLWKRRASWDPSGSPRAFLYTTVRNLALKEHRHLAVRRRKAPWVRQQAPAAPDPQRGVRERELREAYEAALDQLPARRREAFLLARQDGLSLKEVAAVMGISPQTAANQVSGAMRDLRQLLAAYLP